MKNSRIATTIAARLIQPRWVLGRDKKQAEHGVQLVVRWRAFSHPVSPHSRQYVSPWYTGAVAHEFRVRGNDFAGGLMFWQLHEGTMVLDNNTFHGPGAVQPYQAGTEDAANRRRSSSHVEVYVMDGETSTAVVHVRGAPSWLRHEARNGASIQTAAD